MLPRSISAALLVILLGIVACSDGASGPEDAGGSIRVVTVTAGSQIDSDGYQVSLNAGTPLGIGPNAETSFLGVAPGEHQLTLSGIEANCAVDGANPETVAVAAGAEAEAMFSVTCVATSGTLSVAVLVTDNLDPDGFEILRNGGAIGTVGAGETVSLANIPVGSATIELGDVSVNCAVDGENPKSVEITAGEPTEVGFEVSCSAPAGGRILFSTTTDGNTDIYVMNSDGTGIDRVTTDPGIDWLGEFSPDGTKIAFASDRDRNSNEWDIYVMNADGTGVERLTFGPHSSYDPAWSPDGLRIAFTRRDEGPSDIWIMSADGLDASNVSQAASSSPTWAPDASLIAFESVSNSGSLDWNIYVQAPDKTGLAQVTSSTAGERGPDWSPDGSRIAFWSGNFPTDDQHLISTIEPDGSNLIDISDIVPSFQGGPRFHRFPDWSPDGSEVVFFEGRRIIRVDSNGAAYEVLHEAEGSIGDVAWGP